MECVNHPGTPAAGTCQLCGKALCAQCVNRFNPPLCEPCLLSHNASVAQRLYLDLAVTAAIFVVIALFVALRAQTNREVGILFGLMLAGAYWGWQFINRLPTPLILMSGPLFLMYLFFKLAISVCVGFLIAPWQICRRIKELRAIRKLEQEIRAGQA